MMDPILETAADRIGAIVNGGPGRIAIDQTTMRSDETVRNYPIQSTVLAGTAANYIYEYDEVIESAAAANGIEADFLRLQTH